MEDDEYHITDEDVEKALNLLRFTDPQHATPEVAREFLEFYQAFFHEAGHVLSDEDMQKLYDKFARKKFKN